MTGAKTLDANQAVKPERQRPDAPSEEAYAVRAVVRAARILELVGTSNGSATLQDLCAGSGLAKASVFRLLRTLEQTLLVERVPGTDTYRLGVRCLQLGRAYLEQLDFRREALPAMERLRDEFGETVHLGVLDENLRVVYLDQLQGRHTIGLMKARVGRTAPAYCTGIGKALLAALGEDPIDALERVGRFERWTSSTIVDAAVLRRELEQVRIVGYALDREEHEVGVKCVGVAIPTPDGAAVALSVAGPEHRMTDAFLTETLAPAVIAAAREVGSRLGANEAGAAPGSLG